MPPASPSRTPLAAPELTDAGPALFRLVRFWSRRWINRASEHVTGELRHVQHILVIEAVSTAESGPGETTVNAVAHQLGLDHSGASRMVRDATAAGYLRRDVSLQDRRRAVLKLTQQGERLLEASHRWQRQTFEELTAAWSEHDRKQLAAYLERLSRQLDIT